MGLKPLVPMETWLGLAREGLKHFDRDAGLYIRPMYWPEDAIGGAVRLDPETTRWCLTLYVARIFSWLKTASFSRRYGTVLSSRT